MIPLSNPDTSAPEQFLHSLAVSTLEIGPELTHLNLYKLFPMANLIFSCCNLSLFLLPGPPCR